MKELFSPASLRELSLVYPHYLEKMAADYMSANKTKEFPYPLNAKASPLVEFENPKDAQFDGDWDRSEETLSRITFFMEYTIQDDVFPMTTKESWEFLRRYPTFYAYNPNPKGYTRIDSRERIRTKYCQY